MENNESLSILEENAPSEYLRKGVPNYVPMRNGWLLLCLARMDLITVWRNFGRQHIIQN